MASLNDDDLAILRSAFNRYDRDHTGSLSSSEFVLFLTRLGKHVKELKGVETSTAKAVFAFLDKDADGRMTFDEFCMWWLDDASGRYGYFTGEKSRLLRKAYDLYSTHASSGGMTYHQFDNLLDQLGIEHTDYDFDALDENDDGVLSFPEFCEWLQWF